MDRLAQAVAIAALVLLFLIAELWALSDPLAGY